MSIDRYPLVIGNPQEHNRYVYVANNPIRYFDPSGFGMVELAIQTIEQIKSKPGLAIYGAGVACLYYNVVSSLPGVNWGDLPETLCGSSVEFNFPTTFPNIPVDIPGFNEFFPDGSDFGFPNVDGFPSNPGLDLPNVLGFPMQPWSPWWLLPFIPPVIDWPFVLESSSGRHGDPALPKLDGTNKVHGTIPDYVPDSWTRSDLEDLADDLEISIQTRQNEQRAKGEESKHRDRIEQELRLLRQILKILSGT